ncbi:MAG: MBL fold metallo-hydrolase [Firmicutes bacterium]|nr:MBL fold metallo-hydrolase [Bacillota bacterium]
MSLLQKIDEQLFYFDLLEQGLPGRSSAYLMKGQKNVLIETGSAPCLPRIVAALDEAGLSPDELDYCIVTHVHLDHAGGAGLLATLCPRTIFVAQERAARHLIDPTRLIAGAKAVYGDAFETYFGQVLPIPERQVIVKKDGESLDLGDRTLVFYDTPGHAKHHFSIHDPDREAIFSGDALGIRYVRAFTGWDFEFILPSTSPTDFDPEGVAYTVQKLESLGAKTVYHTHFGPSPATQALTDTLTGATAFAGLVDIFYNEDLTWEELALALQGFIGSYFRARGYDKPLNIEDIGIDIELDAKGLLYYAQQKNSHTAS